MNLFTICANSMIDIEIWKCASGFDDSRDEYLENMMGNMAWRILLMKMRRMIPVWKLR